MGNDILDAGGFKWNEKREIVLVFRDKADVKRGLDTLNALKFEGEQIRCKLDNREGTRRYAVVVFDSVSGANKARKMCKGRWDVKPTKTPMQIPYDVSPYVTAFYKK